MSEHFARSIVDRLQGGSYLSPAFADPRSSLLSDNMRLSGSTLASTLEEVARMEPASAAAAFEATCLELAASYGMNNRAAEKPFVYQDGVGVIPVHGMLINRFSQCWGFVTGYNFIRGQMRAMAEDPDVEVVAFDYNTFGGGVSGCDELAEEIYELRKVKKTVSVVDAFALSAGYYLASAASKVIVTPTGMVGSIGVITTHISFEKMLKEAGIEVTQVFAGAHKADASPYEKLDKQGRATLERIVSGAYEMFVKAVARNRGMDEQAVRDTEAALYLPVDGKAAGLLDAVEVPSKAVALFLGELGDETESEEDPNDMTVQTPAPAATPAAPAAPAAAVTPAVVAAAPAPVDVNAAVAAALTAERARASGIRALPEAAGRETLANHCIDTGMTVEMAKGVLAAAPAGTAPAATTAAPVAPGATFNHAMDASGNPTVGAGGNSQEPGADDKRGARGAAARASYFGEPLKTGQRTN